MPVVAPIDDLHAQHVRKSVVKSFCNAIRVVRWCDAVNNVACRQSFLDYSKEQSGTTVAQEFTRCTMTQDDILHKTMGKFRSAGGRCKGAVKTYRVRWLATTKTNQCPMYALGNGPWKSIPTRSNGRTGQLRGISSPAERWWEDLGCWHNTHNPIHTFACHGACLAKSITSVIVRRFCEVQGVPRRRGRRRAPNLYT